MNGSETILASIACCSMLAAVSMAAFAYRLNEKWTERNEQWLEICAEQNRLIEKMNIEWTEFYGRMQRNDRD